MLYAILLILGLLVICAVLTLIMVYIYGYLINSKKHQLITKKKVTVIVPCKGIEINLKENLQAMCDQDYTNYSVTFVVDSKKDSAYPIIKKVVNNNSHSHIEYTKKIPVASGKIAALLSGLEKTKNTDIYVFADSDIQPHKKWLTQLVSPLSEKNIDVTTGFRWFFPTNLKSSLLSTWNMASTLALFHPICNYAWGGSTAITKELFEKLDIKTQWKKGFSDDLILTQTVKKAGYKIKFIPQCIVKSSSETDLTRFLKWGTQQFTWVRWYYPFTWITTFCGMILLQTFILLGFILLLLGYTIPGILMISGLLLEMIFGLTGIITLRKLMCYPKKQFGNIIPYAIFMPIVFLLFTYNFLISSVKKEIRWAGKSYRKKDALKK